VDFTGNTVRFAYPGRCAAHWPQVPPPEKNPISRIARTDGRS
jgi:hypothetical protein